MDGLNPNTENGRIGPELKPDSGPATLNIKVAHGLNQHELTVPSNSTFGDLKSIIVQKMGLKPESHKLLFRGKEKDDDESLQTAGVKDNCKLLLMEDMAYREIGPEEAQETKAEEVQETKAEEVQETKAVSLGVAAVAEIREEIDKLADQVAALQTVVDSGTEVDSKSFIYLTEMLMRELLKLDSIEAEGEGRLHRKMEVRRVQSLVETLDNLKSKNSNPITHGNNVSVTTQWETFETGTESLNTVSAAPSLTPAPAPSPTPAPASTPTPTPSAQTPVPPSTPAPVAFTILASARVSSSDSSVMPSSTKVTQEWEHFE